MRKPSDPPLPRGGFTLVELLAVIAILSILVALLLPAIFGARTRALDVQVKSDISSLVSAIQSFKQDFGIEPPSQIILYETATGWTNTDPLTTQSKATIGRLWPQFNFGLNRDINDDGDTTDVFTLRGAECLVFFLGGVVKWNDTNGNSNRDAGDIWVPSGFSRNDADPFDRTGTNRRSYFTFVQNRLVASAANQNFFGYSDPISGTPAPYLYISSNEGQGYNAADLDNVPGPNMTAFPSFGAMTDAYRNGTSATSPYYNPNGFQIISAGADRKYGVGGPYQKGADMGTARDAERDNITNFSDGRLAP